MTATRYGFRRVVSGFFELPTENARRIVPSHLEPVELHHGSSILSVTAFDFTESLVGAYGEIVMAVLVMPLVRPGATLPKGAFFPYLVGTTTKAARDHAIERWHLPHWMEDVEMTFRPEGRRMSVAVTAAGDPVVELTVSEYAWEPVSHPYQCFMKDGKGAYMARVLMEGSHSEHEEETGRLVLHDHGFNRALQIAEVSDEPFRELWMRDGVQSFESLIQLQTA